MTDFSNRPTQPIVKPESVDCMIDPPAPLRGHVTWLKNDLELIHYSGLLYVIRSVTPLITPDCGPVGDANVSTPLDGVRG